MDPKRPAPSRFRPQDYYTAALARLQEARDFHDTARDGLALTQAGVAAECVLRAFFPEGEVFDSRHDLAELARKSRLRPRREEAAMVHDAAVNTLRHVWRNSYRYMTEEKIDTILRRLPEYRKGAGRHRALHRAALEAVEAAGVLVKLGEKKWTSRHV